MPINKRILVAEDEEEIRSYLQMALRCQGYSVELAQDGEEALRLLRQLDGRADPAPGRDRSGQRGHGEGNPRKFAPRGEAFPEAELRRFAVGTGGERIVRLRARRFYGRLPKEAGHVRAGRWRHSVTG